MAEEKKTNLEPIQEEDLNLKEKFIGDDKTNKVSHEKKVVAPHFIEGKSERKEGFAEKEIVYSNILAKMPAKKQLIHSPQSVDNDAKKVDAEIDKESKITNLVNLAEQKGIPHAVKVARHLEDNYTLDEFHDRLMGEELHQALIEKGLIKEI